jgi:uncharacterized protein (DUF1501 family)
MSFTRREFLQCCGRGVSAATMMTALGYAGLENAFAQTGSDYKALVCIFLEGGNDGWNTVVPMGAPNSVYTSNRQGLALPLNSLLPLTFTGTSPGQFGFHPRLVGLRNLFNQGRVAVVNNVGNLLQPVTPQQVLANPSLGPSGLFDHFQQQTYSQSLTPSTTLGWGNSVGGNFTSFNAGPLIPMLMTMVNNTPFLRGPAATITLQPNIQLGITGLPPTGPLPPRFAGLQQVTALLDDLAQVNALNGRVSRAIDDSRVVGSVFSSPPPFTTVFPATNIGDQLRQIAIAISARSALGHNRRQLFYAQVPGNAYDFHGTQLASQDRLLGELDAAMTAFFDSTVQLGVTNEVTTFIFSEFGRTIRINGDGSDHGWGNHYLVMGGSVLGGRFYGTYPPVQVGLPELDFPLFSVSGNFRGAFIPTISFDQLGFTLARWFGLSDAAGLDVFPNLVNFNASTRNIGFLG